MGVNIGPAIYSLFDDDPTKRECVETFIFGLAGHIDDLQEAELGGDLREVERLAKDLSTTAGSAGYPVLVNLADSTIAACLADEADEVRKGIVELTELAQRVRRGSRGSA